MGAIFAMRELNLSLFTFRYRGHMVDYTALKSQTMNISNDDITLAFGVSRHIKKKKIRL